MRRSNFFLVYLLLVVAQILICNYFHLTPYVTLSLLPVMVLCLPIRVSTTAALFIAFATGLSVDLLAEGLLGLNTLALLPVAFIRMPLIRLIFGEDLISRKEDFTVRKNGIGKVTLAILLVQALFLLLYIWADGAGTRPFWFNALRFGASLAAGYAAAIIVIDALAPDSRK
jgi:hypothetical protein